MYPMHTTYAQSYVEKRLSAIEAMVPVTEIFLFYIFLLLHLCTGVLKYIAYEALRSSVWQPS